MINSKHWLAALDLTRIDDVLIGYASFLTSIVKPKTITCLHIIESGPTAQEIFEQFPELKNKEEFEKIIRKEINEKIDEHFNDSSIDIRIVIKEGRATDQIINVVNSLEPDLLLMGKKIGYAGEGVIPKQILKYVPASILFVPENCRYSLETALVPVDFSEQSAYGIKTAKQLTDKENGTVIAQHIYRYRAQFFPYMLSVEEKEKIDQEIAAKREKFVKENEITSDVNFVLTRHSEGKLANSVYNQVIKDQADIIIIASKVKKLPNLIRHDFTDKMLDYSFGVPLLIQKNKERYRKFLKSLFSKS